MLLFDTGNHIDRNGVETFDARSGNGGGSVKTRFVLWARKTAIEAIIPPLMRIKGTTLPG
jgi:hypothetical protein